MLLHNNGAKKWSFKVAPYVIKIILYVEQLPKYSSNQSKSKNEKKMFDVLVYRPSDIQGE